MREGSGGSRWRLLSWGDNMQNSGENYASFTGYEEPTSSVYRSYVCVPLRSKTGRGGEARGYIDEFRVVAVV